MYIRMIPTANQREQRTVPEAFSGGLSFIAFEVVRDCWLGLMRASGHWQTVSAWDCKAKRGTHLASVSY